MSEGDVVFLCRRLSRGAYVDAVVVEDSFTIAENGATAPGLRVRVASPNAAISTSQRISAHEVRLLRDSLSGWLGTARTDSADHDADAALAAQLLASDLAALFKLGLTYAPEARGSMRAVAVYLSNPRAASDHLALSEYSAARDVVQRVASAMLAALNPD